MFSSSLSMWSVNVTLWSKWTPRYFFNGNQSLERLWGNQLSCYVQIRQFINIRYILGDNRLYLVFSFSHMLKDYAPVKLFCPHPPGHPRGHHFLEGCPGLLITLFFSCLAIYKHYNHSFFQCPALIHHTHFSSDPGAFPGGWGQNNLTGALFVCYSVV